MTEVKATTKKDRWAAAFLAAQSEFPEIEKDSTGGGSGSFTYKYASLPAILRVVLPVLHKHGLAIYQKFEGGELVTMIMHESGQAHGSYLPCSAEGMNPQDFGKKITYYRRYALVAMLGLAPDEDVDAAGVDAPEAPPPPPDSAPTDLPVDMPLKNSIAVVVDRLLKDDKDLVKAWSPTCDTVKKAARAVTDLLDVLSRSREFEFVDTLSPADRQQLYGAARAHMNQLLDERAAAEV